jgi:hypothetical protein
LFWFLTKNKKNIEENVIKIREIQKGMNRGEVSKFIVYKNNYFLYGPGLAGSDYNLGILYMLAVSSLATYGILLAGLKHKISPPIL